MPEQPLPPLDALQAQLRGAVDQQFAALRKHHEDALAEARQQAADEAQRQLESVRTEWTKRLETEVATARKEGVRTGLDMSAAQVREQIQQAAIQTQQQIERVTVQKQQELDRAVAATKAQAQQRIDQLTADKQQELEHAADAAKTQAQQQIEQLSAQKDRDLEKAVAAARAEAQRQIDQVTAQKQDELDQAIAAAKADAQKQMDGLREQKQQEIDQAVAAAVAASQQQIDALDVQKQRDLDEARAQAQADAHEQAQRQIDAAHAEKEQDVAAAKADAQHQVDQAVAAAKQAADAAFESERQRAQAELEAERAHLQQQIADAHASADRQLSDLREHHAAEITAVKGAASQALEAARPATAGAASDTLLAALQDIDGGTSLSQVFDALLRHIALTAGRAAVFFISGDRLTGWKAAGIPPEDVQSVESSINGRDLLARAIQSGQLTRTSPAQTSPPFARLAADRDAAAVPLFVGGRPVAIVYGDNGGGEALSFDSWAPAINLLARHASTALALVTATRTLELMSVGNGNGAAHDDSEDQAARRYARLLISEIKLYNEGAVRVGRQHRDLLQRLRSEIDRARQMYKERIPSGIDARQLYFQQELVQTLADGDPALLGTA